MDKVTRQMEEWAGTWGKEYTDRNALSLQELELLDKQRFGSTRSEINNRFLGDLDRNIRILEVGSNIGNQLQLLQNMGFKNLYGIDLQHYAVELSKSRTKNINIIQGSIFDIPFKDKFFDLVFTSGVLIHIAPHDIEVAMSEMYRCSRKYLMGFEYYSEKYTMVKYRGHNDLLWKTDFSGLFLSHFKNLKVAKQEFFKHIESDNVSVMYLLEKNE